jgi:nuclease S1
MWSNLRVLVAAAAIVLSFTSTAAHAWGGLGHRTVAAIAEDLIPPDKAKRINVILRKLEMDNNFVDAASYPDEFIRNHDAAHHFDSWHFADLPDDNSKFECNQQCLFDALQQNLAIVREGKKDKAEAVALAWVIHLTGDLHQPLHMSGRLKGGNGFQVKYRGKADCKNFKDGETKVELHSAWDDCLVEELAGERDPETLAKDILGGITSYKGRSEIEPEGNQPWLAWGNDSHALSVSVAFDSLQQGADLEDPYIKGKGKALDVVQSQLLKAGIRLAYLLDQNFK